MAAYDSAVARMSGVGFQQFRELFWDWSCEPVFVRGELCGAILHKGPDIHACIKPEGFRLWVRKAHFGLLQGIIDRYGYAQTSVRKGNEVGDRFVRRLGFEPIAEIAGNVIYRKNHGH